MIARASLVALLVASCRAPSAERPANADATPKPATDDDWRRSTWEDRHDTMTFLVLPNMARTFQKWKHAPYPDLTCRSCHGADAEQVAYRMPALRPVDPAATGPTAAFMRDEVTPQMAQFLETLITCGSCHRP